MSSNIKKITPDPIITSTIELRFEPVEVISTVELLSVYYPIYASSFPEIKEGEIPKEIKSQRPELKYHHDYKLSNSDYSISLTPFSIAFENVGEYKLWENYFKVIKENLEILAKANLVQKIERIGMRYATIFVGKNSIEEAFNFELGNHFEGYTTKFRKYVADYRKGDVNLYVQINDFAKSNNKNKPLEGLHVDIDVTLKDNIPERIDQLLYEKIDLMHSEEKEFLFDVLMKSEFRKSLNIQ